MNTADYGYGRLATGEQFLTKRPFCLTKALYEPDDSLQALVTQPGE